MSIQSTKPIVKTLAKDRLKAQIAFQPDINRFVVNPNRESLTAQTYPEAVLLAESLLKDTDAHRDTIRIISNVQPAIEVACETLFRCDTEYRSTLVRADGKHVSHYDQLPVNTGGQTTYLAFEPDLYQRMLQNTALINLLIDTVTALPALMTKSLTSLPVLAALLPIVWEVPSEAFGERAYRYADEWQKEGEGSRNHRELVALHQPTLLMLLWCQRVLFPAGRYLLNRHSLVFNAETYNRECAQAKAVTKLYRAIVAHCRTHPDDVPIAYRNKQIIYCPRAESAVPPDATALPTEEAT